MNTDPTGKKPFSSDPDKSENEFTTFDNFDEPPRQSPPRSGNRRSARPQSFGDGFGKILKGLSELTEALNNLSDNSEQSPGQREGHFTSDNKEHGFAVSWNVKTNFLNKDAPDLADHETKTATSSPRPSPVTPAEPLQPHADLQVEIHDEAAEGLVRVIVEPGGRAAQDIHFEIHSDVLIISITGDDLPSDKEFLLPAQVEPTPYSRTLHNGVLELRFKKIS